MSILCVNRSKIKYCVNIWYDNIELFCIVFKVKLPFSMFKSKVRNLYLEKYLKILMLRATMIIIFSGMRASNAFQV